MSDIAKPEPTLPTRTVDYEELVDTLAAAGLAALLMAFGSSHIGPTTRALAILAEFLAMAGSFAMHYRAVQREQQHNQTLHILNSRTMRVLQGAGIPTDVLEGLDQMVGQKPLSRRDFEKEVLRNVGVARGREFMAPITKYAEILESKCSAVDLPDPMPRIITL